MHKLNIFDLYNEQHKNDVKTDPEPEIVKPADLPDNIVKPEDIKQPAADPTPKPAADPTPASADPTPAPDPEPNNDKGDDANV